MLTLTDLLSSPSAAPEGLHARLPGTVAAAPSAGFAATLASARTAAEAVPGLPVSPIPRAFPGAPPGGKGLEETGEAATAAAFPVPPGFGEPLPVPREPLGAAISTISREGTGHGRPGGNGLPLPGSDGGKTLPDVPPVRPSAASSAAIGAPLQRPASGTATDATAGSPLPGGGASVAIPAAWPAAMPAPAVDQSQSGVPSQAMAAGTSAAASPSAVPPAGALPAASQQTAAAAIRMSMAGATVAPTVATAGVAAAAAAAGSIVVPPTASAGGPETPVQANPQAVAADLPGVTRFLADRSGPGGFGPRAVMPAAGSPASSTGAAGVMSTAMGTASPAEAIAGDGAAGQTVRLPASASAADAEAGTAPNGASGNRSAGAESTATERALMSRAQPQNQAQTQTQTVVQTPVDDGAALRREPGSPDFRLPWQQGAVAQDLRSMSQNALQPGVGMRAEHAQTSGRADLAAAGLLDRRLIAEAAGQRRGGEVAVPGGDEPDRTPATGTESADQASRPQTARPVVPVLAGRDLAALTERIEMMMHRRGGIASVNLSLSELGDVEISVRIESRQAHVQFVVQDAAAREALEAQLPRLRAMLGDGGLDLGDVGTSLRDRAQGDAHARGGEGGRGDGDRAGSGDGRQGAIARAGLMGADEAAGPRAAGSGDRLLDAFA